MGIALPDLGLPDFSRRLGEIGFSELESAALERLHLHYRELQRWNPRLNLIGPGTRDEVVERHFGESLAALPLVRADDRLLVDVGSGGGFPGLVVAAARPDLRVVLIESRARKCEFLRTVAQKCALDCVCLNARVGVPLPPGIPEQIDVVTVRAVRLAPQEIEVLTTRIVPGGRLLLWTTEESFPQSAGIDVAARVPLAGAVRRHLVALERTRPAAR